MNPTNAFIEMEKTVTSNAGGREVHLLDVLTILLKRRRFILYVTASAAAVGVLAALLLPIRYTAETIILPPSDSSSAGGALLSQLGASSAALASFAGAGLGMKSSGEMYVSLLHTVPVEDALVHRFGLMDRYHRKKMSEARRAFESRSSVVYGTKDGLIRISVSDWDAKFAADLANGYVEELRQLTAHLAVTEASQRRQFFEQQMLESNEKLAMAEEAMKHTEQTTGVMQIDSQAKALIESAATVRGQIGEKEVELQALRSYATENNPKVVVAQQELAALRAQLARLGGAGSESDIVVTKGRIPEAQMEYVRRLRDLRYAEAVESILAKQFEAAKLDEAREGAVIQVAAPAIPPDKRSFPKRTLLTALATILGFIAACAGCFVAEGLERMRRNPAEQARLAALRAVLQSREIA